MLGLSVNAWPTCIAWLNECNNCWWDSICISDLPKYMVIRWVPVSRSLEDDKYILSIITSQNTLLKIHKNSFWKRKCAVCYPKWMNEWTEHLSCHLKKNGRATIPFSEDDRTSLQRFAQHLGGLSLSSKNFEILWCLYYTILTSACFGIIVMLQDVVLKK